MIPEFRTAGAHRRAGHLGEARWRSLPAPQPAMPAAAPIAPRPMTRPWLPRPKARACSPRPTSPTPASLPALKGATVFDGRGGRIDNGVVFMSGGKITSVGGPDTPIPADIGGVRRRRQIRHPRHHRYPLAYRRLPITRGGRAFGRERGDQPDHARSLGRTFGLAARPRLSPARSPMVASPLCRSCPVRPT